MANVIRYCVAPGCQNNSAKTINEEIVYHNLDTIKQWHKFAGMKGYAKQTKSIEKDKSYALCSAHFLLKDYEDLKSGILKSNATPSVHADFNQNDILCYICLKNLSNMEQYAITEDVQSVLENHGLGFIQEDKIPKILCESCNLDVEKMIDSINWLQKANDFWHNFGLTVQVIKQQKESCLKVEPEDFPAEATPTDNWRCDRCNVNFTGKYPLYKHEWKQHAMDKSDPTLCTLCNKNFSSEWTARSHYFTKHFGERSKSSLCKDCGFLGKNQIHLRWHRKYYHSNLSEDRISCEWCFITVTSKESLEEHMQYTHTDIWAKSRQKNVKDESKDQNEQQMGIDNNQMNVTVKQEKPENGNETNGDAKPNSLVKRPKYRTQNYRKKSQKPDHTLTCPDCKAEITGKLNMATSGLYRHYWMRHARIESDPSKCKDCPKTFKSESSARLHYFEIHFQKHHKCDICGKSDLTKGQLHMHMKMSHLEKKDTFPCKYCDKRFIEIEKLAEHEYNHSADTASRPYQCQYCFKAYRFPDKLKEHLNRHLGKKTVPCQFCDKKFYSRGVMKQHERLHTGPAFKCRMCDATFNQLGLVQKHAHTNHKITDPVIIKNEIVEKITSADKPEKPERARRRTKKEIEEDHSMFMEDE